MSTSSAKLRESNAGWLQKITAACRVLILGLLFVPSSGADSWERFTAREIASPGGKHVLEVIPHGDWARNAGHCLATLFKVDGHNRTKIWSRHLINNHAPVQVFVTDSGKYVVTMDEWHRVGELPVVIYGRNGELIKVHSTDSLGLKDDILHIKITVSSYWWNEDAVSFFDAAEDKFLIRRHWGKWIVLNLRVGELFTREQLFFRQDLKKAHEEVWKRLDEFKRKALAEHAIAMLTSKDAGKRKAGALVCGQERLSEAIPKLRGLLTDTEYFTTNVPKKWTRVYHVRKAAKEALELMGEKVEGVVVEEPDY